MGWQPCYKCTKKGRSGKSSFSLTTVELSALSLCLIIGPPYEKDGVTRKPHDALDSVKRKIKLAQKRADDNDLREEQRTAEAVQITVSREEQPPAEAGQITVSCEDLVNVVGSPSMWPNVEPHPRANRRGTEQSILNLRRTLETAQAAEFQETVLRVKEGNTDD